MVRHSQKIYGVSVCYGLNSLQPFPMLPQAVKCIEDQSLKLALRQPKVSSHQHFTVGVFIIAEF